VVSDCAVPSHDVNGLRPPVQRLVRVDEPDGWAFRIPQSLFTRCAPEASAIISNGTEHEVSTSTEEIPRSALSCAAAAE